MAETKREAVGPTGPVASVGNGTYGINDAMALMRKLPMDSDEKLVVSVVRTTLESTGIEVASIVTDGSKKLDRIEKRVGTLEGECKDLEEQVQRCRERIAELRADVQETVMVKQRLLLAQQSTSDGLPPPGGPRTVTSSMVAGLIGKKDEATIPDTRVEPLDGLIKEE